MSTPLHEAARVSGGKIVQVHNNYCPSLDPEQPGRCNCGEVSYRLVITGKQLRSHLTISERSVR